MNAVTARRIIQQARAAQIPADSQYDNDLLNLIASESPTFTRLVNESLQYLDQYEDDHLPTWLGSFMDGRPKTQIQLVVTQNHQFTIDED